MTRTTPWRLLSHALAAALVLANGCVPHSPTLHGNQNSVDQRGAPGAKPGAGQRVPNLAWMRVFYATDRNAIATTDPHARYGGSRGTMSYGTCLVSIPRDHRMGELEAPSIWRLEFSEDPARHVVLRQVNALARERFFEAVKTRVAASPETSAFVFVHGYNTSFEDAARRTAQISYDLGFTGAPIFYSWPSRAVVAEYPVDETNAEWSRPHLRQFLADLLHASTAQNVYLIAHSMGNRVLTSALLELEAQDPSARARIREIILTAPDIDADVFNRDIAPRLVGSGADKTNVTLYTSVHDLALQASKTFHGYARAGEAAGSAAELDGMETIDASSVRTDLIGHSYYGDSGSLLSDLYYLFHHIRAGDRFGLERMPAASGARFRFKQ